MADTYWFFVCLSQPDDPRKVDIFPAWRLSYRLPSTAPKYCLWIYTKPFPARMTITADKVTCKYHSTVFGSVWNPHSILIT